MKINSITIRGLHNVQMRTYSFKDINYIFGNNGAGKSTILQAIQLALLGYIPGTNKTNQAIFNHANSKEMEVILSLSGPTDIVITRTWRMKANGVQSTVTTSPEDITDLTSLISEIELPIFNFSEFTNMSANQIKDWFIKFLPNDTSTELNWTGLLKDALAEKVVLDDTIIPESVNAIKEFGLDGVEEVRAANQHFKSVLSWKKQELERLQSTIQSLVYYDEDTFSSEEDTREALKYVRERESQLRYSINAINQNADILAQLGDNANDAYNMEQDNKYQSALQEIHDLTAQKAELSCKLAEAQKSKQADCIALDIEEQIIQGQGICTYTGKTCDSIVNALSATQEKADNLRKRIHDVTAVISDMLHEQEVLNKKIDKLNQFISYWRVKRDKIDQLKRSIVSIPLEFDKPISEISKMLEEVKSKRETLEDTLIKIQANKRYNELITTLTSHKFAAEQTIDALKIWIKLTDANGLQSKLMAKPFENISEDLTIYLQTLFGRSDVSCRFVLSEKANSFTFGLSYQDGTYVEYNLLSSGEKCLYALALMICLIQRANCPLKLIMIDDMLDHLDDSKIQVVFDSLMHVSNTQFILAGVKPCHLAEFQPYIITL